MRPKPSRVSRLATAVLLAVVSLAAAGCATIRSTISGYERGPDGITRPQQRLREALVNADYPRALEWPEDDAVLRSLDIGVASYYANQFARSASVLDSAALLADDRITTSLSKEGLSLVTNDLARPYAPRRTERLFIPYYAMLAYARLEQWEDAAVEARRLSALLALYAEDRTEGERRTHAMLHFLAAAVFARAGDPNAATVSLRIARATAPEIVDSGRAPLATGDGEILLVVERGFVAHRATESINIFLGDEDRDEDHHHRGQRGEGGHGDSDDDDGYWLAVAFPTLRRSAVASGEPLLQLDNALTTGAMVSSVVDDAAASDEQRERAAVIARATARAATKYVLTKAVKDKTGEVAGHIANISASLLERADVRSWHLLPQRITLLRVRAAAGSHAVHINVDGADVDLGAAVVRPGQVSIVATRLWNDPSPRSPAAP